MAIDRKSARKIVMITVPALLFLLLLWSVAIEPGRLTVEHTTINLPDWHGEHSGIKIALLSDLHVGAPHMSVEKLRRVVESTNAERPDLIVILGDLVIHGVVGGRFVAPEATAAELQRLSAPLGVYTVLGNHDWWYDGERVTRALNGVGLAVLENDVVRLEREGKSFWLVGLADMWTRKPDIAGALKKIGDNNPVVAITHNPDLFPEVPERIGLLLAGHTHGGQVNLPLIGRPVVPSRYGQRYAFGHVIEGRRHLYVTGGIGTSILPVRFRVPPEIVILTINTAQ